MIARNRDGSDCAKVVDFGIAKAADNLAQKVTKTGLVVGTPEYMSPEQLAGDKLDGRSDIYALALVAFNMLTGRLPFPADTVQESMIMRLTESPRKLAEMRPDMMWSGEVQATLDKALERDANVRFQTATEFGQSLSRALERMTPPSGASEVRASGGESQTAGRGSLPVTRVRGSGRPEAASMAPDLAGVTQPITRRGHGAAYSAGGVILAAALAASAIVLTRKNEKPLGRDSVTPPGGSTSEVKSADTTRFSRGLDSTKVPAFGASTNVSLTLDSLEKVVSGEVTPNEATLVIRDLEQMKSRIKGNEQIVQAAIVDALAESSRRNKRAACAALQRVQSIARGTTRARRVAFAMTEAC